MAPQADAQRAREFRDKFVGAAVEAARAKGGVLTFLPPELCAMGLGFAHHATHVFGDPAFWQILALGHDERTATFLVAFLSTCWDGDTQLPEQTMRLAISECGYPGVVDVLVRLSPQASRCAGPFLLLPLHFSIASSPDVALHACVLGAYLEAAQTTDGMGFLPLHLAARLNRHDSLRVLLRAHPAGASVRTHEGLAPAEWLALAMPLPALSPRLGLSGALPLHLALEGQADSRTDHEDASSIGALCDVFPGALLVFDAHGNLPVHLAAALQAPEDVVRQLLLCVDEHKLWACLTCRNALKFTALEMAVASGAGARVVRLWLDATCASVRALHARLHSSASGKTPASTGGLTVMTRSTLAADARFRATVHWVHAPAHRSGPRAQTPLLEGTGVLVQTAVETETSFQCVRRMLSCEGAVVQDGWARAFLCNVVGGKEAPRDGVLALLLGAFPAPAMRFCPERGDLLHVAAAQELTGPGVVLTLLKLSSVGAKVWRLACSLVVSLLFSALCFSLLFPLCVPRALFLLIDLSLSLSFSIDLSRSPSLAFSRSLLIYLTLSCSLSLSLLIHLSLSLDSSISLSLDSSLLIPLSLSLHARPHARMLRLTMRDARSHAQSRNARRELPLHVLAASSSDKTQAFKALLCAFPGAASEVDDNGQTPLHRAVGARGIQSPSCSEITKHLLRPKSSEVPAQQIDARGDTVLSCLMRALVSDDNCDHYAVLHPTAQAATAERQCLLLQLVLAAWPEALFSAAHSGLQPLELLARAAASAAQRAHGVVVLTRQIAAVVLVVTIQLERDSALAERGAASCLALHDALCSALPPHEQDSEYQNLLLNICILVKALDLLALEHERAERVRAEILQEDSAPPAEPAVRATRARVRAPREVPAPIDYRAVERACARTRRENVAAGKVQRARFVAPVEPDAAPAADVVPAAKAPAPEAVAKQVARLKERLHAKSALVDDLTAHNEALHARNDALQAQCAHLETMTTHMEVLQARVCALEESLTQQLLLHRLG